MNYISKLLIFTLLPLLPSQCEAEVFIMKDNVRFEGIITGKSEGRVLVKTKYGNLILKESDIEKIINQQEHLLNKEKENKAEKADKASKDEEAEVINSADLMPAGANYVFSTAVSEDGSAKIFYFRDKNIIATEFLDKNAKLINISGKIPDRVFTEYYETGQIKTIKPMQNGRQNGLVESFYPNGNKQFIAHYKNGLKEGTFAFYSPQGKIMIEAEYKADKLDGQKKDYDSEGKIKEITWYKADLKTTPPAESTAATSASTAATSSAISESAASAASSVTPSAAAATSSAISESAASASTSANPASASKTKKKKGKISHGLIAKIRKVARGSMYFFYLNNRYIGKAKIDKDYNVLMIDGHIPDGEIKIYNKNNLLHQKLIFKNGEIITIILFNELGKEKAQYIINEKRMAIKLDL